MITINDVMTKFNAMFGSEKPTADRVGVHDWLNGNRAGWMHGSAHDAAGAAYDALEPSAPGPAQYAVTTGPDGMNIGRAFALENGDIVIECAALPVSGQMRLRKVTP